MPTDRASVEALQNLLDEIETLISTTPPLPENRTPRCLELLRAAKALAADFAKPGAPTHALGPVCDT